MARKNITFGMPYCLCIYSVEGQARSEYEEKSLLLKKLGLTIKEMNEGINCIYDNILTIARCLKITEKVSFNIASGQKKTEACCQTVLPDRLVLIGQKLAENAKIQNLNALYQKYFPYF